MSLITTNYANYSNFPRFMYSMSLITTNYANYSFRVLLARAPPYINNVRRIFLSLLEASECVEFVKFVKFVVSYDL